MKLCTDADNDNHQFIKVQSLRDNPLEKSNLKVTITESVILYGIAIEVMQVIAFFIDAIYVCDNYSTKN